MTLEAGPRGPAGAPWISLARNIWLKVTPLNSRNDSEKEVLKKKRYSKSDIYTRKKGQMGTLPLGAFLSMSFGDVQQHRLKKYQTFNPHNCQPNSHRIQLLFKFK